MSRRRGSRGSIGGGTRGRRGGRGETSCSTSRTAVEALQDAGRPLRASQPTPQAPARAHSPSFQTSFPIFPWGSVQPLPFQATFIRLLSASSPPIGLLVPMLVRPTAAPRHPHHPPRPCLCCGTQLHSQTAGRQIRLYAYSQYLKLGCLRPCTH